MLKAKADQLAAEMGHDFVPSDAGLAISNSITAFPTKKSTERSKPPTKQAPNRGEENNCKNC